MWLNFDYVIVCEIKQSSSNYAKHEWYNVIETCEFLFYYRYKIQICKWIFNICENANKLRLKEFDQTGAIKRLRTGDFNFIIDTKYNW